MLTRGFDVCILKLFKVRPCIHQQRKKELFIKDKWSILPFHFTASHTRVEVIPILSPTVYEIRNIKHT